MNFKRIFSGRFIQLFSVVILSVALLGGAYFVGYKVGRQYPEKLVLEGISNPSANESSLDFNLFWEAWKKLKDTHIKGANVSEQDMLYGAIAGVAGSFGDQNTILLRGDNGEAEKFSEDINGHFGGIGAEIGVRNDQIVIVAPLKASPAEKAGLESGDQILKIDGEFTRGITVNDAVKKIRGPLGEAVVLEIYRDGWPGPKDISIKREEIKIPNIDSKIIDGNLLYVTIYTFNGNLSRDFRDVVNLAVSKHVNGIILDLRNNPGGFLQTAIDLAGWFLEKGSVVVKEQFRSDPELTFRTTGSGALKDIPMVVLINRGSASASEILAGALRDQRGVQLIGETSFGKGTVQELDPLSDGSNLKITIANWLLPNGQAIEKNGLKPDYEVPFTEDNLKDGTDPQLDKAIEIVSGKK
ncbi:MAG: hypothetical protein COU07_00865 [Candidatus Harrisonbacteria bacterium CG10_big_fil_rev_8_21_14_0_10_40_38]|uniref:PDZ domain-containing protein n=1 Tax=Candidatus Harrisonbacteria bacterium CG10_big_fil_rev_8_21_14_0_10_40_38 TaxID=1974583 RepID=A0A2H0USS2_9BACT|nr:MAG: hypothetical protein COU07_00865 [Candidatus Harrisonbacteria bacterium CG10_big_fil_rev_8_21_14_0_10_40_38]